MIVSMISFIEELGVYGGSISILAYIILLERLKRKAVSTEEEQLYKIAITNATIARMILIDEMNKEKGYDKIIKHSSEKVLHLLNILKEFNPEYYTNPISLMKVNLARQPLSGIIFTRQRFTAKIIYNILKEVKDANPEEFAFLKHDFIVGFNINPFKNTREQFYCKKASQTALLKFSNKELNCLISTSVIEEGVDIPQCLLVLRYDPPLEYRSYIQSKGRARCSDSTFVVMVNVNDKEKFMKQYQAFQNTERYIQKMLVGSTDDRGAPSQEDIEDGLYNDDEVPPYFTSDGARLSAVQAISLLNRYCSALPHDQFTIISPMWIEEKVNGRHGELLRQVKIYMPIACPVRDIISGEPKIQLKAAKRSAALNACITLHKAGELDSYTLLPKSFGTVDFDQPDVKACFPNWPFDNEEQSVDVPRPGSKKRVRKHKKAFPSYLKGLERLSEDQKFYLHIIQMKTAFSEPKDSRENSLYKLLQDGSGYGFLTLQALPTICDFPLFLTVGEVNTSIKMNYAVIQLNSSLFSLVKRFHYFLFDQVLEVAKKFATFDGTENCMYIVPVKLSNNVLEDYDIDWTVMQTYTEIRPVLEPSLEERRSLQVTQENYKYHVVSPWYRGYILPTRYIVSNVLEYLSPQSQFSSDDDSSGTFADYYFSKYNLEVLGDNNQPLLEVRSISSRYNCLVPRAATINAFTEKQLKMISLAQGEDKPKAFPEVLIPEFCILYDFPGVLWFKATVLPSVVHRVFTLLVAYELRVEISKKTQIGVMHLPTGQEWEPIEVNLQVTVNSLLSLVEEPQPVQSFDRINNPIDEEAPRPTNIVTMKQSLYELQRKKISQQYNWDESSEPIDIERNLTSVTVMDVECYDEFVSTPMPEAQSLVRSPQRSLTAAAIMPSPVTPIAKIMILGKRLTARGPELRDILSSITTIKCHDTFNFERVETLGDSFLKFAGSLYLYHRFPKLNEGQLTNIKGRFIGNRNLFYAGAKVHLGGRMKVENFSPKNDFLIPGFFAPKSIQRLLEERKIRPTSLIGIEFPLEEILSGELSEESWEKVNQKLSGDNENMSEVESVSVQVPMQCYVRAQAVADKTVADCVEALIGTYLLSDGILGAVKVLEWLKVFPPEHNFASLLSKQLPTVLTEQKTTEAEINRILNYCRGDIETILGYNFKDVSYLLEALSHVSYIRNRMTRSYERLEFLGDAILDFLITSHIFESCPDLKPGDLTDLRSALVNNVTFASYVVKLGLHKFLCYQLNPALESAIMTFIEHQEQRDHNIVEDVLYLIDEEDCQIAEYVEVPKVLSDIFESLAGAIYLDSGGDLDAVWAVYYRIMCKEIHTFSRRIPQQPVRVLYEKIHACPEFGKPQIANMNIQKVMIPVTITKNGQQITVHGFGSNKFQAKRAAAKLALKVLGI